MRIPHVVNAFESQIERRIQAFLVSVGFLVAVVCTATSALAEPPASPPQSPPVAKSQAELERAFEETLSGATLVGHFTIVGEEGGDAPKKERYTLEKVKKLDNGKWLFVARIQYGEHDLNVPLPLPVHWAGDTPVITVDKFPVPGLGTFTARVLIYDDHYAGFWSGADHGGHLFGVIERPNVAAERGE